MCELEASQIFVFNVLILSHSLFLTETVLALFPSSSEWRYVSDDDRERLTNRCEDGEFW